MALFKFLRTPNPSQYDYKPRFWDPEKERIEKRLAELESRKNDRSAEDVKGNLSGSFRSAKIRGVSQEHRIMRRTAHRRSNYMLLVIIFVLVLLGYALLSVNLQGVLEFLN